MANVVIFGAGGRIGSQVVAEAAGRHHVVTAVVHAPRAAPSHGVVAQVGDVTTAGSVEARCPGAQVVVCSAGGPDPSVYLAAARTLVGVIAEMGDLGPRIIHCGGGGSLLNAEGVRLVDTPDFPPAARDDALGQAAALDFYRASHGVVWTYLSPPPGPFLDGPRTTDYRSGTDHPVVTGTGQSSISVGDFAYALVDEIEIPRHMNARFTVGY